MTVVAPPPPTSPHHPTQYSHLTDADVERLGQELDRIRDDVLASRGAADAAYIRRVIAVQRALELGGRVVLLAQPPAPRVGASARPA